MSHISTTKFTWTSLNVGKRHSLILVVLAVEITVLKSLFLFLLR